MSVISRFIRYYRPYRRTLFYDLSCATTLSGVDLVIPLLINHLLKTVFPQIDPAVVFRQVLQVAAVLLVL